MRRTHHSSLVRITSLSISVLLSPPRLPVASSCWRMYALIFSSSAHFAGVPEAGMPAALRWLRRLPSCCVHPLYLRSTWGGDWHCSPDTRWL
jgi:hypothetical protein